MGRSWIAVSCAMGLAMAVGLAGTVPGVGIGRARAASPTDDPLYACDRAAVKAETDWSLPSRVLSAIGIVESGRHHEAAGATMPWPWTVNAAGRGYFLSSKQEAIGLVRAMYALGVELIDVGCFQVDLYYHSRAFANLEEAFDPDVNARAAARILTQNRMSSASWEMAIAMYHSASPIRGAAYLSRVQGVWPFARSRLPPAELAYAVILGEGARQVRLQLPSYDPANPPPGLPRVVTPQTASGVLQWTSLPAGSLPVVVQPPPRPLRRTPANPR
ncbi:MAG: lytic transglycosylase domain-containing protein [Acetobacteraceae bacterium]